MNTPHVAARKSAAAGFSFRLEQRSEKRKVVSNRLVMFDYCPFHLIEFSLLKKWQYFQYLVLVSCDELWIVLFWDVDSHKVVLILFAYGDMDY